MLARLTIYQADRPGRQILLEGDRDHVVGRDDACSIHIEDHSVSRRHAKLSRDGDAWRLSDLCSKNGTFIDGRAIGQYDLNGAKWIEFGMVLGFFDRVSPERVAADRRRAAERWTASIRMSRDLRPTQDAQELLRRTLESFVELAEAERGFVMLREAAGELGARVSHPSEEADFQGSRSVVDRAFGENRAVACNNVRRDPLLGAQASIVGGDIAALACTPMRVGSQLLGVIYVDSRQPGKDFTEQDVEILQSLADHAALVIGVAQLRETIVDLSAMLPRQLDSASSPGQPFIDELQRHLLRFWQGARTAKGGLTSAGEAV